MSPPPSDITREAARKIVEAVLSGTFVVARIATVEELRASGIKEPNLYGGPPLEECWIAYLKQDVIGLRSSQIILVSRRSGEILYRGSARDEG